MIGDSPRIHDGASNQMINLLHICNASAMEVDNGVNGMQSSHDGINALVPQIQYSDANYIGASVRKEQVS